MKNVNIGDSPINDGDTVQVDHNVTTFVVTIRSMGSVGVESIKDLIERKFEVVDIKETDQQLMVKKL